MYVHPLSWIHPEGLVHAPKNDMLQFQAISWEAEQPVGRQQSAAKTIVHPKQTIAQALKYNKNIACVSPQRSEDIVYILS